MKEEKKVTKKEEGKVSNKTILIIVCVVLVIGLIAFYFYRRNKQNNTKKIETSYLLENNILSNEIKSLNEVDEVINKDGNIYILITYTNSEDNYNLEVGLKDIINNNNLKETFYYLNVDNIKNEDNYLTKLNDAFNIDVIKKVPVILYYKDGTLIDTVKRYDDNTIKAADFQKLLDIYE